VRLRSLDLSDLETATALLELQRRAYRVEANLIGFDSIPPLHETIEEVQNCGETFLGAFEGEGLTGAVSWRFSDQTIDIHRLVVDPDGFRRGTGSALVRAALAAEPEAARAIVQTGAANAPASALYLREGFERVDEIDVGGGLRVARFVRHLG
jgi:ribosomal protein S18 acetylase RimI-like enzyme